MVSQTRTNLDACRFSTAGCRVFADAEKPKYWPGSRIKK